MASVVKPTPMYELAVGGTSTRSTAWLPGLDSNQRLDASKASAFPAWLPGNSGENNQTRTGTNGSTVRSVRLFAMISRNGGLRRN